MLVASLARAPVATASMAQRRTRGGGGGGGFDSTGGGGGGGDGGGGGGADETRSPGSSPEISEARINPTLRPRSIGASSALNAHFRSNHPSVRWRCTTTCSRVGSSQVTTATFDAWSRSASARDSSSPGVLCSLTRTTVSGGKARLVAAVIAVVDGSVRSVDATSTRTIRGSAIDAPNVAHVCYDEDANRCEGRSYFSPSRCLHVERHRSIFQVRRSRRWPTVGARSVAHRFAARARRRRFAMARASIFGRILRIAVLAVTRAEVMPRSATWEFAQRPVARISSNAIRPAWTRRAMPRIVAPAERRAERPHNADKVDARVSRINDCAVKNAPPSRAIRRIAARAETFAPRETSAATARVPSHAPRRSRLARVRASTPRRTRAIAAVATMSARADRFARVGSACVLMGNRFAMGFVSICARAARIAEAVRRLARPVRRAKTDHATPAVARHPRACVEAAAWISRSILRIAVAVAARARRDLRASRVPARARRGDRAATAPASTR